MKISVKRLVANCIWSTGTMHTLNEYKEETMRICAQKGWNNISIELLWMLLIEEIGELASSIRRATNNFSDRKRSNVVGEWFDVLSYLFQIADRMNIDLDDSFERYVRQVKCRRIYGKGFDPFRRQRERPFVQDNVPNSEETLDEERVEGEMA